MDSPARGVGSLWHASPHTSFERAGTCVLLDSDTPNWIATDRRGAWILSALTGGSSLEEVARGYASAFGVEAPKAFLHVDRLAREAARRGFASQEPKAPTPYAGRAHTLAPGLRELWIHTNNSCNLACQHCLVSSDPAGDPGLRKDQLLALIDEAVSLGVERFFFTGGEPFYRQDIFELIERVTQVHGRDLTILTNGILFQGGVLERLRRQDPSRLHLQVSLDGATAATNDPLRGQGSFARIVAGISHLVEEGFPPTVATVVGSMNVGEMVEMVHVVKNLRARSWHLIWAHKKGRWADKGGAFVPPHLLHEQLRRAQEYAEGVGLPIDNIESFRQRVNGVPGTRVDLASAAVSSLCVYSDGRVYPSAATVQYDALELGRWSSGNLGLLLETSEVARQIRALTVRQKPICNTCTFRYICGGGDIEHSYSFGVGHDGGNPFDTLDPYCDLYQGLILDRIFELAEAGRAAQRTDTGFGAPVVYHAMGDGNLSCAPGGDLEAYAPVRTSQSNCVLSVDLERPRSLVRDFYAKAAETPQPALCCPVSYDREDIAHIPRDVLDRFYGCGGPMSLAGVRPGETVVDLGCGAGIDVFIAAKKVGPQGKAIGIDMTDPMLGVAGQNKSRVAEVLGYDAVELRKGYLEEVPLPDKSADVVTSNCVINLSPDKRTVFREMWRILKDHGRIVVSDIVADRALPPDLKVNVHLWGECVSGALPEDEFVSELERAGFYGIAILKKEFWKEVEGHDFTSVTVRGYKFQKTSGCVFLGHRAVYLGPYVSVTDEEGHLFPRGREVEICTDTLAKLSHEPYRGAFLLLEPGEARPVAFTADCGPGCC